jgi:aspartate/glutamate racemase
MRAMGLIGGMSWESSLEYYKMKMGNSNTKIYYIRAL